jgi:hypothetical protein
MMVNPVVRGKISLRKVKDQFAGCELISLKAVEGQSADLCNYQS